MAKKPWGEIYGKVSDEAQLASAKLATGELISGREAAVIREKELYDTVAQEKRDEKNRKAREAREKSKKEKDGLQEEGKKPEETATEEEKNKKEESPETAGDAETTKAEAGEVAAEKVDQENISKVELEKKLFVLKQELEWDKKTYNRLKKANELALINFINQFSKKVGLGNAGQEEEKYKGIVEKKTQEIDEIERQIRELEQVPESKDTNPAENAPTAPVEDAVAVEGVTGESEETNSAEKVAPTEEMVPGEEVVPEDGQKNTIDEKKNGGELPKKIFKLQAAEVMKDLVDSDQQRLGLENNFGSLRTNEQVVKRMTKAKKWKGLKSKDLQARLDKINAEMALGQEDKSSLVKDKNRLLTILETKKDMTTAIGKLYSNLTQMMFADNENIKDIKGLKNIDAVQYFSDYPDGKLAKTLSKYTELFEDESLKPQPAETMSTWGRRMITKIFELHKINLSEILELST